MDTCDDAAYPTTSPLQFETVRHCSSPVQTHSHPTDTDNHPSIMSEPYDPYLPRAGSSNGGTAPTGGAGNSKTAAIQAQIDNTVEVMRENITRVQARGEDLDNLQGKTDTLAVSAQGFRKGANRVRKNMWWKDMKMRIIIGVAIVVILVIIIVSIVKTVGKKE